MPFVVALSHDIGRPFHTTSDQDLIHVHEALRMGAGLEQLYRDHTGYLCFVLLSWWYKALNLLGLLPFTRVDQLPPPGPAFDAAMDLLVKAGRWWSAALSAGLVLVVWRLAGRLTACWTWPLLVAALFAGSEGLARHALILRTELLAIALVLLALYLLLRAIERPDQPRWMALTGLAAVLATMAKMQVIPLLLGLPVLAFAFARPFPREKGAYDPAAALLWVLVATPLALVAGAMVVLSLWGSGAYQAVMVLYVLVAVAAYARLTGVPATTAAAGGAALVAGASAGYLSHLLHHSPETTAALANFVEHMSLFATGTSVETAFKGVLAMPVARPFAARLPLLLGLLLAGWCWLRGQRRAAVQGGLLLGLGLAFEVFCSLRYLNLQYYIFIEIWPVLAVALCARPLPRAARMATAAALAALVLYQAARLGEPSLVVVQPPENACYQLPNVGISPGLCRDRQ